MSDSKLHTYKTFVSFGDTDSAKRIYFARVFDIAHKCLEDFAQSKGYYERWFNKMEWATPIIHTEADYNQGLFAGDEIEVHLYPGELGNTSLQFQYVFEKDGKKVATVKTVHVSLDLETGEKKAVPTELAELF